MDATYLRPLITQEEIAHELKKVASQIKNDYRGKDLVIVMVLKGAVCLVADLIREIDLPFALETVQCSSYGARGTERGELQVIGLDRLHIHNRDCLIVDDIFDSGRTLAFAKASFETRGAARVLTCVLVDKQVPRAAGIVPDFVGFTCPPVFVVGYGLDYRNRYRELPFIGELAEG